MLNQITLGSITEDMMAVIQRLESAEGDMDVFNDTLESLGTLADDKLEGLLYHMDEINGRADFLKEKSKKLAEAANVLENKSARIKEYIDQHLKATNRTDKRQVGIYTLSYRAGSKSTVINEQVLPEKYWIPQDPKPMSKTDLKKLVESGENIPGVSIVVGEPSLQIK